MTIAFVLMTAMPPTIGHLHLIHFATSMPVDKVNVLVATQPKEPFVFERYAAVRDATSQLLHPKVTVSLLNEELPQDPETEGFWKMWEDKLSNYGAKKGDWFITSEPYGARLAEIFEGTFMIYDPKRELTPVKATAIRENPLKHFKDIIPEFQKHLRTTVTIFGAESTGKTTLSKEVCKDNGNFGWLDAHWLYEWARPYLETVGPEITLKAMHDIHTGQTAAQKHMSHFVDKPFIVQDTDLFSTIGYWEQPHWAEALGPVPDGLISDAQRFQSDLYVITQSNIPFEQDPIRYGGTKRESSDEYWIGVAEKYGLNYIVLDRADQYWRLSKTYNEAMKVAKARVGKLAYDREGF